MVWKPDYIDDLTQLRDFITRSDVTVDDEFLTIAAGAASRAVDRHTGRQFGKTDTVQARRYTARWNRRRGRYVVTIDDLYSAAGLVIAVPDGPVSVFELEPVNALADGLVYERLVIEPDSANLPTGRVRNEVTVTTDKWGWPAFPVPVVEGTLLQASRLASRRNSPYGIAGSPDDGSEMRLLARVDPDVAVSLGSHKRRWFVA
ncbi:phage gp6-like head-tail connector protein [Phytohabitans rumicis]|uniref:Uncharacterized protein n=1 Tax=Phytohabitans rumicis TaxID=1076125 RepID=A0A6V8L7R3_9ACTN|nr:phage gp6-like head-tail connector protein [Phytohabitans rumicis]GFJ91580.1 hypothetical protein Prum_052220 [Phytohabitans rumicis]